MVLLDLIGAANPTFYNTFRETNDLFERMQLIGNVYITFNNMLNRSLLICDKVKRLKVV